MMVRVGGGYNKFDEYVPSNAKYHQRNLLLHMLKSKMSLEAVCECIMNDSKIPQDSSPFQGQEGYLNIRNEITIERRPPGVDLASGRKTLTKRASTAMNRSSDVPRDYGRSSTAMSSSKQSSTSMSPTKSPMKG